LTTTGDRPQIGTLLEALPYIREFFGKTIVIKYGGSAMADESLREAFATDVVLLKYVGMNPVIVHGGGREITDYMKRLGLEVKFVQGLRVSDEQTVEVAKMVLVGKLNKDIVLRLNRRGQAAVGLCGDDGSLFQVTKRLLPDDDGRPRDLGFVGAIERVDVDVLNHVAEDYIPVVASVGADAKGQSYNVNADEAAGAVAASLGAHKVIFLTDVEGWLADAGDPATLVSETDVAEIRSGIADGRIAGGMLPKLEACAEAVERGVLSAHIVDGRLPHSLLLELFTDAGIGTKVRR
jgi:acetylglutamate kinase